MGPPLIHCQGEQWLPPTSRVMALIAYLLGKKTGENRQTLIALLWETAETTGRHRLRQELYRLHHSPLGKYLRIERDLVRIEGLASDTSDFLRYLSESDWSRAVGLWRGGFMAGFSLNQAEAFDDWLLLERETWCNRYILARSRRALEFEATNDLAAAAADWQAVLECDPLHEEALKQLLRLLASLNRWTEMEEALSLYRSRVHSEFGMPPDSDILDFYRQLKQRQAPPKPSSAPLPTILQNPPLVGRQKDLEKLASCPRPALIKGEAGSGKSRLARELALRLKGRVVIEHSAPTSRLPYAGVTRALEAALKQQPHPQLEQVWLREVGRLVPHLLPAAGRPISNGTEQARFLEGVARTLLYLAGPILVWEDLQWSDQASLELLSLLLNLAPQLDVRLVMTLRTPLRSGAVYEWLQNCLQDGGVFELELSPLSEKDLHQLIKMLAHQDSGADLFARRLHAATGGNPFFVIETLRHLFASGELRQGDRGWSTPYDQTTRDYRELPLPSSVREALRIRLTALDNQLRRSLQLVALAQGPVTAVDLAAVLGIDELEAAAHLEALHELQLLRARGDGFSTAHDHLRQLLLETYTTSLPTYHRAWARALSARQKLALSAQHWLAAGDKQRAAANLLQAARQAAPQATLSALALYERALELADWLPSEVALEARFELLELRLRLGRLELTDLEKIDEYADESNARKRLLLAEAALQRGDYQQARQEASLGLELAIAQRDRVQEARAHFILAWTYYRHGDPEAQLDELEKALAAFEEAGDLSGSARVLRNLAALNYRLGRKEAGDSLQKKTARLAKRVGDSVLLLRLRADRATGMWLRGEYPEALRSAKRLLAAARRLGDIGGILDGLELVGLSLHKLGDNEAAFDYFDEFTRLAERFGIEKDLALALSERALPLIEQGRWQEAENDLQLALEIQERIGDQAKLGHTYYTFGYLQLRRGDPATALGWLIRAAAHWRSRDELGHLARSLALAALSADALGEREQARNLSSDALKAASNWRVGVPDLPLVYAVYGRLHNHSQSLKRAQEILDSTASRLSHKYRQQFIKSFVYVYSKGL